MLRSINPYDQSLVGEYNVHSSKEIDNRINKASLAFNSWRREKFDHRASLMIKVGNILRKHTNEYAKVITLEMGKTLREAKAEVEKCASVCDYFASHAERLLKDQLIETEATKSFIAFQPLGPVLAIMPWNFPLWQVFRFAAPSLMAGNVGLLKHASNVTQCSLIIENVFHEAGFPEGVFQSLLIQSNQVEDVIAHSEIAAVTLTGSEHAGSQVASAAGKHIKKTVLELGGSDAFIVLEDADLELAAKVATESRMRNAGQSCIAAKRFIVVDKVKDAFLDRFKMHIESLRQGNPMDENTTMGPMARVDLAEEVEKQMQASIHAGAKLITGGTRTGCNFIPTLLDNVKPGMPAFKEEIFGPVASIIIVKNEEEAISMANDNRYGLGGSVWTKDLKRGEYVARSIETGCVFVNSLMRSDQRLPFGGIKKSGYGRELSELGIKEFANAKTIFVA